MFGVPLTHHDACIAEDDPCQISSTISSLVLNFRSRQALPSSLLPEWRELQLVSVRTHPHPHHVIREWKPFLRWPELRVVLTGLGSCVNHLLCSVSLDANDRLAILASERVWAPVTSSGMGRYNEGALLHLSKTSLSGTVANGGVDNLQVPCC